MIKWLLPALLYTSLNLTAFAGEPPSNKHLIAAMTPTTESVMILAMVVLGGMGNIWGVVLGAILLSFVPELLRYTVEPAQKALFGRQIIEAEVLRMLIFGFAMVAMMLFRPAGLLPSAVRKRELARKED